MCIQICLIGKILKRLNSLENYFRARLDELSSSEKRKMEEINNSLYYLCTELNKKKRLGRSISDFTKGEVMKGFICKVRSNIQERYKVECSNYPINAIRIMLDHTEVNKLAWHQDEATWYAKRELRGRYPFTFWLPILSQENSAIEICKTPEKKFIITNT